MRQRGRGPANALLGVRAVRTDHAASRIGFAVPKKVGSAVVRNRLRRRLRAIVGELPLAPGWDIVIAVRPPAATARFDALAGALRGLLGRHLPPGPFPGREGELPRGKAAKDGVRSRENAAASNTPAPLSGRLQRSARRTSPPAPPTLGEGLGERFGPGDRGPQP